MNHIAFPRNLLWMIYGLLALMVSTCTVPTETASPVNTLMPTVAEPASTWEKYTNTTWKFSVEYPMSWVVSENGTDSGFFGKQVFWWAGTYDPMQQHGDDPAVDEMTELEIDGQPAIRVSGHFQGAIADMGFQQYLKYVIHKGDVYFMFTLHAVDALGVPPDIMNESLSLQENDVELFEQMIATVEFSE